jgi:hypothetical protein
MSYLCKGEKGMIEQEVTIRQFTKAEAIAMFDSLDWKEFTDEEIVKLQLFQRRLCVPFDVLHGAVEAVLGRPVYTHEFAFTESLRQEYLGQRPMPTFEEILELIPEDKRIVIYQGGEA